MTPTIRMLLILAGHYLKRDDGKECYIEVEYDGNNIRRYGEIVIDSQTIREIVSLPRISTSPTHETFAMFMQR